MHICPRVMELLHEKGLDDVLVVVGGIIPDVDIPKLQRHRRQGDLPAGHADAGHHRLHQRQRPAARGARIATPMPHKLLLADDSVTIQRVIELTFADEDVQVVAVGDGKQAIERIDRRSPDIVLADVGMPERDGYEVAAFIKGDPAARAHPGAAAGRRVRAGRRGARARRRLRRRAGQAVRAADGDQSRQGTAARAGARSRPRRARLRSTGGRRGSRPPSSHERWMPARWRRPPAPAEAPRRRRRRSRTTSIGSTPRSPTSAPRRPPVASSSGRGPRRRHRRTAPAAAAARRRLRGPDDHLGSRPDRRAGPARQPDLANAFAALLAAEQATATAGRRRRRARRRR